MRVYLDNCCYNRPFDEQSQLTVRLETEAKMRVQAMMRFGEIEYAWSTALDYEIRQSPFVDRIEKVLPWRLYAAVDVVTDDNLIGRGVELMNIGLKKLDALHLASAERAIVDSVGYWGAERFVVLMNRDPGDYTAWRAMQPDTDETMEELGEKLKAFDRMHNRVQRRVAV